jgi:outer membrane protein OmpA-like peptidoglycan-associated protein
VIRLAPLLALAIHGLVWAAKGDIEPRLVLTLTASTLLIEGDVISPEHADELTRLAAEHFSDRTLDGRLEPQSDTRASWEVLTLAAIPLLEGAMTGRLVLEPGVLDLVSIVSAPTERLQTRLEYLEAAAGDDFSIHSEVHVLASPASSARSCERMFRELANSGIRFRFGTANLTPSSHALLDRYAEFAQDCPHTKLLITGHTDSWGDEALNQVLSEQRARAVRDYLVAAGVDPARLNAEGKGSLEPLADNDTTWGRSRNRRIELTLAP